MYILDLVLFFNLLNHTLDKASWWNSAFMPFSIETMKAFRGAELQTAFIHLVDMITSIFKRNLCPPIWAACYGNMFVCIRVCMHSKQA